MMRCDHCGKFLFRARARWGALRFCSEKCKGEGVYAYFCRREINPTVKHLIETTLAHVQSPPVCDRCGAPIAGERVACDGKVFCAPCHERWHNEAFLREWFAAVEAQP